MAKGRQGERVFPLPVGRGLPLRVDCGLASAFLILRATELGLVAHPIAGFSPARTREVLGIPEEYRVIALIIVGKKAETVSPDLTPKQARQEIVRRERKALRNFVFINYYKSI